MSVSSILSRLAINDEGFVFDPATGESFVANATGLVILRALQRGESDEVAAKSLTEVFEVTDEEAQGGIADFRARLSAFGLR
jgi:hypothetical protein